MHAPIDKGHTVARSWLRAIAGCAPKRGHRFGYAGPAGKGRRRAGLTNVIFEFGYSDRKGARRTTFYYVRIVPNQLARRVDR